MKIHPLWLRRTLGEVIGALWLPLAMLIDGSIGFANGVATSWADYQQYRTRLGYRKQTE